MNRMTTKILRMPALDLGPRLRRWWQAALHLGQRAPRSLRVAESLPLGERRFVAVIEFEKERFLLGGTTSSLVLLARLDDPAQRDKPMPGGRD